MGRRPAELAPKKTTINGGQVAWLVMVPRELRAREGTKDGRRYFPKEGLAQGYCNRLKSDLRNYSDKARGLSDAQKIEAQECFEKLAAHPGANLTAAVDEYIVRLAQSSRSVTLKKLGEEFQKTRETLGGRGSKDRTLQEHRIVWARFEEAFPERLASSITEQEVHDWLFGLTDARTGGQLALQTRRNIRRVLHAEFAFAGERVRRWVAANPVTEVKLPDAPQHRVVLLEPLNKVTEMLEASHPRLLPYLAACAFAGARPDQAKALNWSQVHFDRGATGEIEVPAGTDKTDRERIVPVQEALRAFLLLTPESQRHGTLFYSRVFFEAMRDALGFAEWPQDCLRHNYCTYRVKVTGSFGTVAEEAGNSEAIIRQRYFRSVSTEVAESYWQIRPTATIRARSEAYWEIFLASKTERQAEHRWRAFLAKTSA